MKKREIEIVLYPNEIHNDLIILDKANGQVDFKVLHYQIIRKSIDARSKNPQYRLKLIVSNEVFPEESIEPLHFSQLRNKEVVIVGAGPAGYFAALELLENGIKPIILERGKNVRDRRRDLKNIQQLGLVNPDSNYCFGEGGAGTYSDGKLYTRSTKRGNLRRILEILVLHGAKQEILFEAHPHIGSNKLPQIISNIRDSILQNGGEIHFESRVTDIKWNQKRKAIESVVINDNHELKCESVILATGHSARDIYYILHNKGIRIEAKPFALGVRIEHPQHIIDQIQYGQSPRHQNLPASSYSLVSQVKGKGVFSFCMCPGGLIVPAATAPGEIVVNGMSMSRRDSYFANSGYVTSIELSDIDPVNKNDPFALLEFQKSVENKMFKLGDGSQKAPAQRLVDFMKGKNSGNLPKSSYIPGLLETNLDKELPPFIVERLKKAFAELKHKMPLFINQEAVIVGTESRTSSVIRIPRDSVGLFHPDVHGLYPCGEGAGYAGGIISAAIDGVNVAKSIANINS